MRRPAIPLVLALLLSACVAGDSTPSGNGPAPTATSPTTQPATTTSTAPLARATTPSCPTIPARLAPDPARPKYTLRADVHPADGSVDGQLRVAFTPDLETDHLVFRLWPNGPRSAPAAARLETSDVTVGNRPATTALEDPTILVVRTG